MCPDSGILFNNKKEKTDDIHDKIDGSLKYYVMWK